MAWTRVSFSASGYGNDTRSFKTRDAAVESIKRDAAEIAVNTVIDYKMLEGSSIKVIFNVFEDEDIEIYRKLLT